MNTQTYIEALWQIHLAARLNPKRVKPLCKAAEKKCLTKRDKQVFLTIRKSPNPRALLEKHYDKFLKVLEINAKVSEENNVSGNSN